MKLHVELEKDEKMNNFGLAGAIYDFCKENSSKIADIDISTIIAMLESQTVFDARKSIASFCDDSNRKCTDDDINI